jgi:parallel beta-helix repeat protein
VTIQGTVTILSAKLVTLSGFTVKGGQGVQIEDSTTIVLSDNAFVESTAEGLLARSSFTVTLRGNLISRNKSHGLLLAFGSRAIITGNTITSNGGDGVTIRASQADLSDNIVRDNGGCGVRADADSTVTGSVTSANFGGNQGGGLCSTPSRPGSLTIRRGRLYLFTHGGPVQIRTQLGRMEMGIKACSQERAIALGGDTHVPAHPYPQAGPPLQRIFYPPERTDSNLGHRSSSAPLPLRG